MTVFAEGSIGTDLLKVGSSCKGPIGAAYVYCTARPMSVCLCMQVIVAERGLLVFVFNLSPFHDYEGYKVREGPVLLLCLGSTSSWLSSYARQAPQSEPASSCALCRLAHRSQEGTRL